MRPRSGPAPERLQQLHERWQSARHVRRRVQVRLTGVRGADRVDDVIDLLDDLGEELGVRGISLDRLAPLDLAAGRERVAGDDRDLAPGIAELRGNRRAEEAGPAEDTDALGKGRAHSPPTRHASDRASGLRQEKSGSSWGGTSRKRATRRESYARRAGGTRLLGSACDSRSTGRLDLVANRVAAVRPDSITRRAVEVPPSSPHPAHTGVENVELEELLAGAPAGDPVHAGRPQP